MIRLVPYLPSLLDSFIEWRAQPASVRHNPLKSMTREEIAAERARESSDLAEFPTRDDFRWFIEFEGAVTGSISLKDINRMMNFAEIGYGIAESHYGRGIATAAVRMLVDICFRETPLRRIVAHVHDENIASRRVLEKAGFVQEGILREHFIINGAPANEVVFGLLKHEWPGLTPNPANRAYDVERRRP